MTRPSVLAPFRNRNFRFQWPADIATSWAFEMENLILGWYVLVETGSVFLLTVFAAIQQIGTLVAPMFGVIGDRIGQRNLLCIMRGFYALQASLLMALAFTGELTPGYVLVMAGLVGMVKPSDPGVRAALVGDTIKGGELMGAMSIQRTTLDSARIAGALAGAGLVAALGMGWAYAVVACFYLSSVLLTSRVVAARATRGVVAGSQGTPGRASPWRDLRDGLTFVWTTPHLLAAMSLAFLLNVTAYPLMMGLMPYAAKVVHGGDQAWLSYLAACGAGGGLVASIAMSRYGAGLPPARTMIVFSIAWYGMLALFAMWPHPPSSLVIIALAGCAQAVGQIPMATLLLRSAEGPMRGRIMGIRMLAIYGHVPGLLMAGPLIAAIGYPAMAALYCSVGAGLAVLIAVRWRQHIWRRDTLANTR